MKTAGIYRIELGNGWFYIGSAVNLKRREGRHRSELVASKHCNVFMQRCWNKYGVFKFTVLEECAISELVEYEQTYLDQHFDDKKNVNIAPTAGSSLGVKHTAESRANYSARVVSAETRAKLSASHKNMSAETRANMSAAQLGKKFSAEHRAKISAATKAYHARVRLQKMMEESYGRKEAC